jgi:hypothetical protein
MAFFVGTTGKSSLNTSFSTKIFAALDNDPARGRDGKVMDL